MAARVIHFGCDDCYRVPVLRNAGYDVCESRTLDELRIDLLGDQQVDAVVLSEDDRRTTEQAATVVRELTTAPLILFRRSNSDLNEKLYDRVYASAFLPGEWLSDTAQLIAISRANREQSRATRTQSEKLRREAQLVQQQTQWQLARARTELRRNTSLTNEASGKDDRDKKD